MIFAALLSKLLRMGMQLDWLPASFVQLGDDIPPLYGQSNNDASAA